MTNDELLVIEFENFLSPEDQDFFENLLFNEHIPWFYTPSATYDDDEVTSGDLSFFRHVFVWDTHKTSPFAHHIRSKFRKLYDLIGCDPWNVRANMTTIKSSIVHTRSHVDSTKKHLVALYFVNTTDGDTIFLDKEGESYMTPQKGKLIIFDGGIKHCGGFPTLRDRAVINFVFITDATVADLMKHLEETGD